VRPGRPGRAGRAGPRMGRSKAPRDFAAPASSSTELLFHALDFGPFRMYYPLATEANRTHSVPETVIFLPTTRLPFFYPPQDCFPRPSFCSVPEAMLSLSFPQKKERLCYPPQKNVSSPRLSGERVFYNAKRCRPRKFRQGFRIPRRRTKIEYAAAQLSMCVGAISRRHEEN
jgi:hypothetical protein